jgi:hypothetical protein
MAQDLQIFSSVFFHPSSSFDISMHCADMARAKGETLVSRVQDTTAWPGTGEGVFHSGTLLGGFQNVQRSGRLIAHAIAQYKTYDRPRGCPSQGPSRKLSPD